jgi:hypothetical protein
MYKQRVIKRVINHDDMALTDYLDNLLYVTMWFETLDYLQTQGHNVNTKPCTERMLHDRPMEEDLLDFITPAIKSLNKEYCQPSKQCSLLSHGQTLHFHSGMNTLDIF